MFARVITATTGARGSQDVVRLAQQQLPDAQQRPGFSGFLLLVDDEAGKAITISLWETREDLAAVAQGTTNGVHDDGVSDAGMGSVQLETYEVAVHV